MIGHVGNIGSLSVYVDRYYCNFTLKKVKERFLITFPELKEEDIFVDMNGMQVLSVVLKTSVNRDYSLLAESLIKPYLPVGVLLNIIVKNDDFTLHARRKLKF